MGNIRFIFGICRDLVRLPLRSDRSPCSHATRSAFALDRRDSVFRRSGQAGIASLYFRGAIEDLTLGFDLDIHQVPADGRGVRGDAQAGALGKVNLPIVVR